MEEGQVSKLSVFRFLSLFTIAVIPITTSLFSEPALNLFKMHIIGRCNTVLIFMYPFTHVHNKHLLSTYYIPSSMLDATEVVRCKRSTSYPGETRTNIYSMLTLY